MCLKHVCSTGRKKTNYLAQVKPHQSELGRHHSLAVGFEISRGLGYLENLNRWGERGRERGGGGGFQEEEGKQKKKISRDGRKK